MVYPETFRSGPWSEGLTQLYQGIALEKAHWSHLKPKLGIEEAMKASNCKMHENVETAKR